LEIGEGWALVWSGIHASKLMGVAVDFSVAVGFSSSNVVGSDICNNRVLCFLGVEKGGVGVEVPAHDFMTWTEACLE